MHRNLKATIILLGSIFVLLHSFSAYAENPECSTLNSKFISALRQIEEIDKDEDCFPPMDNPNKRPECSPYHKSEVQGLLAQMNVIKAQMAQLKCYKPSCFIPGLCDY